MYRIKWDGGSKLFRKTLEIGLRINKAGTIELSQFGIESRVLVQSSRLSLSLYPRHSLKTLDLYFNIRGREKLRSAKNYSGSVNKKFNPNPSNRNPTF